MEKTPFAARVLPPLISSSVVISFAFPECIREISDAKSNYFRSIDVGFASRWVESRRSYSRKCIDIRMEWEHKESSFKIICFA
ncbi:hypothetical protein CEXT_570681 [Caerostris extrusa]|uniref:Secreted protein n=1 Tax=Caerostris extrusa TaxID=172846 RepID=A0AAV4Y6E9_CAEEX|nr:hypothetical protein CEXT_570681 [Caerostris extrusa]